MLFTARIDRPMGSCHPRHPDLVYRVNYGEIPGVLAADGDWQDVYVLGVDRPVETFTGELIAVIRRRDDVEDKWVLAPEGVRFTAEEIMSAVRFQEQYFDSYAVLDDAPLIIRRVDESLLDTVLAIRMDCLREVCGYGPEHVFPPEFIEETADFLRTADQTTLLMLLQADDPDARPSYGQTCPPDERLHRADPPPPGAGEASADAAAPGGRAARRDGNHPGRDRRGPQALPKHGLRRQRRVHVS